jgi:3-oxoacyl-[acyl-carrier-protein] synthase-3
MAEKTGIPFSKVRTNMEKYANTAGATVPLLLNELNRSNKLRAGDMLLLAAVGAGWTYGTILIRWEKDDTYFRGF